MQKYCIYFFLWPNSVQASLGPRLGPNKSTFMSLDLKIAFLVTFTCCFAHRSYDIIECCDNCTRAINVRINDCAFCNQEEIISLVDQRLEFACLPCGTASGQTPIWWTGDGNGRAILRNGTELVWMATNDIHLHCSQPEPLGFFTLTTLPPPMSATLILKVCRTDQITPNVILSHDGWLEVTWLMLGNCHVDVAVVVWVEINGALLSTNITHINGLKQAVTNLENERVTMQSVIVLKFVYRVMNQENEVEYNYQLSGILSKNGPCPRVESTTTTADIAVDISDFLKGLAITLKVCMEANCSCSDTGVITFRPLTPYFEYQLNAAYLHGRSCEGLRTNDYLSNHTTVSIKTKPTIPMGTIDLNSIQLFASNKEDGKMMVTWGAANVSNARGPGLHYLVCTDQCQNVTNPETAVMKNSGHVTVKIGNDLGISQSILSFSIVNRNVLVGAAQLGTNVCTKPKHSNVSCQWVSSNRSGFGTSVSCRNSSNPAIFYSPILTVTLCNTTFAGVVVKNTGSVLTISFTPVCKAREYYSTSGDRNLTVRMTFMDDCSIETLVNCADLSGGELTLFVREDPAINITLPNRCSNTPKLAILLPIFVLGAAIVCCIVLFEIAIAVRRSRPSTPVAPGQSHNGREDPSLNYDEGNQKRYVEQIPMIPTDGSEDYDSAIIQRYGFRANTGNVMPSPLLPYDRMRSFDDILYDRQQAPMRTFEPI